MPFAEDDEEPDGAKKMPAAKDKPGIEATKAAGNVHQEQKHVQPSTCCSLPQVESLQAAAKATQESDEDEEDSSRRQDEMIGMSALLLREDDEPPERPKILTDELPNVRPRDRYTRPLWEDPPPVAAMQEATRT